MRRRKVTYPKAKTATSGASATRADERAAAAASRVANINLEAMTGRAEVQQGARVRIASGLYAGEIAVVESVVGGVIPAAVVRTEAGRTRRVRTIDLIPVTAGSSDGPEGAEGAAGAAQG